MKKLLMTVVCMGLLTVFVMVAASQSNQVTICHAPPGNPQNAHTITVGAKAAEAHLANHSGDHFGPCEVGPSNRSGVVFALLATTFAAAMLLYRRKKGYQM